MDLPQAPAGPPADGEPHRPPADGTPDAPPTDGTPDAPPAPTAAADGTELPAGISDEPPAPTAAVDRPAPAASAGGYAPPLVSAELRIVAAGALRLLWWWPGIVVVLAAYVAVALAIYHHLYPNLWGGLAAAVAALAWYGSPMRNFETRRRARLRAGGNG